MGISYKFRVPCFFRAFSVFSVALWLFIICINHGGTKSTKSHRVYVFEFDLPETLNPNFSLAKQKLLMQFSC